MIIIYTQPPSLQKAGCRLSGLSLGTGHNKRRGHLATPNWETRLLPLSSLSTRLKWIEQTLQKGTPLGFRCHFPFFFGFKHYMVESEGSHPRSQIGALSKGPLGRLLHLSQFSLCLPPITFETSERNKPTFLLGELASPKWWKQFAKNVLEYSENGLCLKERREGEVFKNWSLLREPRFQLLSDTPPSIRGRCAFSFFLSGGKVTNGQEKSPSLPFPCFPLIPILCASKVEHRCDLHFDLGTPSWPQAHFSLWAPYCLWISFDTYVRFTSLLLVFYQRSWAVRVLTKINPDTWCINIWRLN